MSEPLRFEQRKRQIDKQADRDQQTDGVVEQHVLTSPESIAAHDITEADDEENNGHHDEHHIEHLNPPFASHKASYAIGIKEGHKGH